MKWMRKRRNLKREHPIAGYHGSLPAIGILFTMMVLFPLALFGEEGGGVGVIFGFKGSFSHVYREGGKQVEEELKPGDVVYEDSQITCSSGRGSWVQMGSEMDLIKYTRFPLSFQDASLPRLSGEKQAVYLRSIGGKALRGKGTGDRGEIAPEELFEWYTEFQTLDKETVDEGFSLVLSPRRSSRETGSLSPLYFKLKPGVGLRSVAYTIKGFEGTEEGVFEERQGEWVFTFSDKEFSLRQNYTVECALLLRDGTEETWSFSFRVFGEKEKEFIEASATEGLSPSADGFTRAFTIAAEYQMYGMKLKAWEVLKEQGVELEGFM